MTSSYGSSCSTSEKEYSSIDGEFQAFSGSTTSGFSDSFWSENTKPDDYPIQDDCLLEKSGTITLALAGAKLWNKFLESGTEMIISKAGRRMFPYVEFSLRGVDPVGMYDVIFYIIPASNNCFKFIKHKWIPLGSKGHEFTNRPFKHPDSPRMGLEWMSRKISFEKVRLTNRPDSKAGIFRLHTYQMYLAQISVVKHDRDKMVSTTHFPLHATSFIAVTAYNNRKVADLKISSNPHSKAFRNPVKRMKIHSGSKKNSRHLGAAVSLQQHREIQQHQHPLDLSTYNKRPRLDNFASSRATSEKACQTELTMEEINQMEQSILFIQLKRHFFNIVLPMPAYPLISNLMHGQAMGGSEDIDDKAKCNSDYRERTMREERREEYNTRIKMWKEDNE